MKAPRLFLLLALVGLLALGCYDVKLRVRIYPTGELLLTHDVLVNSSVYEMRLSGLGLTQPDVEKDLQRLLEQDAALVGRARVIDATVHREGDNMLMQRRLLFDEPARVARYLDLLGLTGEVRVKKNRAAVEIRAEKLELSKLVRLGKFYEEQKESAPGAKSTPSGDRFTLLLSLPGEVGQETPLGRREEDAVSWTVEREQFAAPFQVLLKTKSARHRPWPGACGAMVDGEAFARALTALDTGEAAEATRRIGGRMMPILHLRLDKDLRVDWALLWVDDPVSHAASQYLYRADTLLLPELSHNYFRWLEVLTVADRRLVAEGYRTRQPLAAKDLGGSLAVTKQGREARVIFTPPAAYREIKATGPASRAVGLLAVTFPDGREQNRIITAADLQSGKPIELTGAM